MHRGDGAGPPATPALSSIAELTPQWCSVALAAQTGGGTVTDLTVEPIGTGQVADTYRVRLAYQHPGTGLASCVAKLTSASAASRAAARATRSYEIEAGFYRDLAPTITTRRPACYHVGYEPSTGAYTVLLEDLAPARAADQLAGCTDDQIVAAVTELAGLHASCWGDRGRAELPWMPRTDPSTAARMGSLAASLRRRFLHRYGDRLTPEVAGLVERFAPLVTRYLAHRPGTRTVVHGDFRADNLVFDTRGVTVLDWQMVAYEPGATDLAYLLGGSLPSPARRRIESDVVRLYAELLISRGVDWSAERCWTEYRRYALGGLLMAMVASALVSRTDRGDEMFVAMANRHGTHALDLDAQALLVGED